MPFASIEINLKNIKLGEINQRKLSTICYDLRMESKKIQKITLASIYKKKTKQTHI